MVDETCQLRCFLLGVGESCQRNESKLQPKMSYNRIESIFLCYLFKRCFSACCFWSLLLANSWPRLKVSHDSLCTGPVSKMQPPLPNPKICCHQTIYIAQSSVPGNENQCMTARHRRYWKHQFQRENMETCLQDDFWDLDGNIAGTWEELHVMILLQWDVCLSARCDISDCRIFH